MYIVLNETHQLLVCVDYVTCNVQINARTHTLESCKNVSLVVVVIVMGSGNCGDANCCCCEAASSAFKGQLSLISSRDYKIIDNLKDLSKCSSGHVTSYLLAQI
jgi:hypothetical protein